MKRTLSVLMMALLATLLIVSCSNSSKKVYTVTFNSNGGSEVSAIEVKEGEKATKPADPTKGGYVFDKWTTDEEGTTEYKFDTAVTADITLYAQWSKKTYKVGDVGPAGGIIFYDVDADNTEEGGAGEDGLISSECGWKYLEGAIGNVYHDSEFTFCFGYYRPEGTNSKIISDLPQDIRVIGKGKSNTEALLKAFGESKAYSESSGDATTSNYAAYVASSYSYGGYSDWFLPSTNEIKEMMNVPSLNVSRGSDLWSSTEYNENDAEISAYAGSGDYTSKAKSEKHPVRPVRSF